MTTEIRFRGRPTTSTLSLACGLSALALSWSGEAQAQQMGSQGILAVGVERVFGIVNTSTDREGNESSHTHFSFLYDGGQLGSSRAYDRPRIGVDYFIIDNLSLGGSLGFYTWSAEDDDGNDTDGSGFLLSPRVGYMVGINERLGFWPRGGFTFVQDSWEGGADVTDSASALSLEAPLFIGLAQSLAMHVALTIDLGIGGEEESEQAGLDVSIDEEHTQFGLQLGMTGFF